MVPIAIIFVSYLTDKYGAKKTVPSSIYAASILVVLLSISPNLFSIRVILLNLGLSNGLETIPYGLISIIYQSKYQSFAYTLLFFSNLFTYSLWYVVSLFFGSYRNQIPNWFTLKLIFLQYPLLFPALCNAIIFMILGYCSNSLLLPSEDKLDTISLLTESDETQTLVNDMDNNNYDSINSSQNVLYYYFALKLLTKKTSLLIISYILNQFLIVNLMTSLPAWYMVDTKMGGLGITFEGPFPTLLLFVVGTLLLSYLYLPTILNKFNSSYIYNITYSIIVIEFICMIVINFLQSILPTFLFVLLVNLTFISLPVCFLYSNLSIILLLSKVKDINIGKFAVFGLAFGGYSILDLIQASITLDPLFVYFSAMKNYYFNILNPSLIILAGVAFFNCYLSKSIINNS
ncbi:hypothetical protein K502DRAFT_362793 [Neoconidiobolus thromboides FSU 785]|nr:hypothetical protein K502DRAFT_362793 [Neoconidiobolus thromboides FSU 785]